MYQVQEKIYFVEAPPNETSYFDFSNSLFIDSDTQVVIDTCCGYNNLQELASKNIDVIVNSHYHRDHVKYNYLFEGAKVWIHTADQAALTSMEGFLAYGGWDRPENLEIGRDLLKIAPFNTSPVHRALTDGEVLDFGRVKLQVVNLPGHTPGHCGFYQEKTGMLFSTDITLAKSGPWYCLYCCDIDDFIKSIKTCIEINPKQLVTSHRGIFEGNIKELLQDYLQVIYDRDQLIYEALQTPRTLSGLGEKWLYSMQKPAEPNRYSILFEQIGINNHLKRMLKNGIVKQDGEMFYR